MNKKDADKLRHARSIAHDVAERRAREAGVVLPDFVEYVYPRPGAERDDKVTLKAVMATKYYACAGCGTGIGGGELYLYVKECRAGAWSEARLCAKCGMTRCVSEAARANVKS